MILTHPDSGKRYSAPCFGENHLPTFQILLTDTPISHPRLLNSQSENLKVIAESSPLGELRRGREQIITNA